MPNTFVIRKDGNGRLVLVGRGPNKVVGRTRQSTVVTIPSPFFTESFDGLTYNEGNGFTWSAPNDVSITSFDGYNAMLFSYPSGGYFGSEQRFNMGRNLSHVWIEYYIHVPQNYVHIDRAGESDNNKWFMLWRETYSDIASGSWQVGWEYVPLDSDNGSSTEPSGSDIRVYARRTNVNSVTSTDPQNDYAPIGQLSDFISGSGKTIRPGEWNQIRIEVKTSTNSASADGIQRMFVNGALHNEITNGKFWNYTGSTSWGGTFPDCYVKNGYFMGASNSGFPQETNFYVRDIKFWDASPQWNSGSVASFTNISRDAASINGNIDVLLTVTAITGSPQVFFGGVPASNVHILNPTTIKCTVPPHSVGKVNVICGGQTLINPRQNKIGAGFEYLPLATTTFASSDFSSGTLSGTGLESPVVSNGGTVTIVSESAYTGVYSVKTTGASGDNGGAKIQNATPIDIASENNGVYVRFYHYMPLSTVANLGDQIKTHLFRHTTGDGQPGWLMTGIGPDFPDGNANETNYVTFIDNGVRIINSGSGGSVNQGRSGINAGAWREFIYWQYYNTASLSGSAKLWIDGKLQFDVTSSYMGSGSLLYDAEMGIAYQQGTVGATEVFIDEVFIGNGFPAPAIPLNESDSFVSTDKNNILSTGTDSAEVTIQLMKLVDGEYIPLAYVDPTNQVIIGISGTDNLVIQPTAITNINGITSGSFTTTEVSSSKIVTVTAFGKTFTDIAVVTTDGPPTSSGGNTPFFQEYFVNGQKNNTNGVTWSVPNNSERVVVSSDYAYSGSHSLKFIYGPDSDQSDSSAEQRFNLGRNLTEVWIEYYLRIPDNFTHRTQTSGGTNNKFFRIWGDAYVSANKLGASSQYSASFSEGNSGIGFEYNYKTWNDGTLGFGPVGFRSGYTPYGGNIMRGQWTRVRMHYRMVSDTDADDALMEMWFNDTKVLNFTNVPQKYDTAKPYWNAGYLMGWANTGYAEATSFYIDAIKFYDTDPNWV